MLVLSFLMVSLYDMNEREVRSMALNDNIKKIREEKDILQCVKNAILTNNLENINKQ